MCFSPEASFASAALLIPVGGYCLWTSRRVPRLWPLAAIPIFFGVQQACEGIVWISLRRGDLSMSRAASLAYLFFAVAFWPTWISLAAAVAEPAGLRKKMLSTWAILSLAWFWRMYLPLLTDSEGAEVHVVCDSIRYTYADTEQHAGLRWLRRALYMATCCLPFAASSARRVLLVPVALSLAAAVVTVLVFDHAFTSVWCLFSAVLSISIAWVLNRLRRSGEI